MRNRVALLVLGTAVAACKKEPEDTGPTESCGDIETTSLESIPSPDWPDNLDNEIDPVYGVGGMAGVPAGGTVAGGAVYYADSCVGPITVKLDNFPAKEDIQVITRSVDPALPCGCNTDPVVTDSDNALGATAYANGTTAFFDTDDDLLDPAVEGRVFTLDWAFFPSTAPLLLRTCAVEPITGTEDAGDWEIAEVALRYDAATGLSGTLSLSGPGEPWSCDLSGFAFDHTGG